MKNFYDLIKELGDLLGEEIEPENNQACNLRINQKVKVQIEVSNNEESLMLISLISELPPGKFRETVLKDILKAKKLGPLFKRSDSLFKRGVRSKESHQSARSSGNLHHLKLVMNDGLMNSLQSTQSRNHSLFTVYLSCTRIGSKLSHSREVGHNDRTQ